MSKKKAATQATQKSQSAMRPETMRAIREDLQLTQGQLAEKLDVHRISVTRWESGEIDIETRTALAVEHLACNFRHRKPSLN